MPTVSVLLTVASQDPDLDDEERDEHAAELGRALRALPDTTLAVPDGGPPPAGSKGTAGLLGVLSVTVAVSRKALAAVFEVVRRWAAVEASRKVVLEIGGDKLEITGATTDHLDQALDLFVSRHRSGPDA